MGQSAVPVTVIIPTLNEAEQIAECIGTAAWADEIIVVDAGSTDATVSIAERAGAVVLVQRGPTIAAQRNAAIARSRNNWILAVDADERITPELREEIPRVIGTPPQPASRFGRGIFSLGKKVPRGHWGKA